MSRRRDRHREAERTRRLSAEVGELRAQVGDLEVRNRRLRDLAECRLAQARATRALEVTPEARERAAKALFREFTHLEGHLTGYVRLDVQDEPETVREHMRAAAGAILEAIADPLGLRFIGRPLSAEERAELARKAEEAFGDAPALPPPPPEPGPPEPPRPPLYRPVS